MIKLKTRSVTMLTDDEVKLVSGGTQTDSGGCWSFFCDSGDCNSWFCDSMDCNSWYCESIWCDSWPSCETNDCDSDMCASARGDC